MKNAISQYGQIESDLRFRLVLGIDPTAPKSLGIAQRVHRSLNPSTAQGDKDKGARKRQFDKLVDAVIPLSIVQANNILPNFGPLTGVLKEDLIPIGIPTAHWQSFGKTLARGGYLCTGGELHRAKPNDRCATAMYENDERATKIRCAITEHGTSHALGPGFVVAKGFAFAEKQDSRILALVTLFRLTFGEE